MQTWKCFLEFRIYAQWLGDADEVVEWLLEKTKDEKNGKEFNKFFLDHYKK